MASELEGAAASSMGVHVKIQIHQRIVNNQSPNGQRPNIHSRPKDVGEKCAEVVTDNIVNQLGIAKMRIQQENCWHAIAK